MKMLVPRLRKMIEALASLDPNPGLSAKLWDRLTAAETDEMTEEEREHRIAVYTAPKF